MNIDEAIAAVKANPPHPESPMPLGNGSGQVLAEHGGAVADTFYRQDAAHIAAAVNAVPVLIAEVERLRAVVEAARVAVEKLWTNCRNDCACVQPFLPGRGCDCGAEIAIELRRALGLEVGNG